MEGRGARVMGARRALVAVLIVALVATAAGADSGGGDGSRGTRSRVSSRNVGAGHQAKIEIRLLKTSTMAMLRTVARVVA